MTREQIYKDIEEKLGLVPTFFKRLSDSTLQLEWELMQRVQMDEGAIPNKYRELIGLGIAAVTKCRYCTYFHTRFARLFGATEAEIEDALHYAKSSAGWSAWLNGYGTDWDEFTREIDRSVEYVAAKLAQAALPASAGTSYRPVPGPVETGRRQV